MNEQNKRPFSFKCPHCGKLLTCNVCGKEVTDEYTADALLYTGMKFCSNCGNEIANACAKALTTSMQKEGK
ncbi:MAG: hypothetical protein PHR82_09815 [Endomicrobiaceae bacterium]|nr:hypothetical protein [Endomicrobiaceae bacterium]